MPEERPDPKEIGYYFALGQVGLEMVAPIVLGLWLDGQFGWSPWGAVAGAVFGLVVGLMHLVYMLNQRDRRGPHGRRDGHS
jgi:F0F1-type ATP synthase assembly protein I